MGSVGGGEDKKINQEKKSAEERERPQTASAVT